jgi:hypothetical protein
MGHKWLEVILVVFGMLVGHHHLSHALALLAQSSLPEGWSLLQRDGSVSSLGSIHLALIL